MSTDDLSEAELLDATILILTAIFDTGTSWQESGNIIKANYLVEQGLAIKKGNNWKVTKAGHAYLKLTKEQA